MSYIYKITNLINNKVYIGKTDFSVEKRWKEHCSDYYKNKKEHRPLYCAMKKYGINNFQIETIEECESFIASEREKYWIEYYGSFKDGYNATRGGDGKCYVDTNIIFSLWDDGYNLTQIHNITNYDTHTISAHLSNYGVSSEEKYKRGYQSRFKPIARIDKNTNQIIDVFSNIEEAKRCLNIKDNTHISEVCKGKRKTAYGYKWKYL